MEKKSGLTMLIRVTVFYLVFTLIELVLDMSTGIHWTSARDLNDLLGWIAIGLLWVWFFVDQFRKK